MLLDGIKMILGGLICYYNHRSDVLMILKDSIWKERFLERNNDWTKCSWMVLK